MQKSIKKEFYSWIKSIVFALLVAFLCHQFLFTPVAVRGVSMEPTIEEKDRLIISKISKIDRFDMIVFEAPDEDEQYVKRVIGLPGDRVEMQDDVLYINGDPFEEPYVKRKNDYDTADFTLEGLTGVAKVPKGYLFVLGDNRWASKDSRKFGFISKDAIIGEVKLRIYPFRKVGMPQ